MFSALLCYPGGQQQQQPRNLQPHKDVKEKMGGTHNLEIERKPELCRTTTHTHATRTLALFKKK